MSIYLHEHPEFSNLLRIIGSDMKIDPALVEKDYWIMHCLHGLQKQGYIFQLKGGTSLSKGFQIIDRFSEDIDMHIEPDEALGINPNPKNNKPANVEKKKQFYDQLATEIKIPGIIGVERDTAFDNVDTYNSGGIRLQFQTHTSELEGLKKGILLEVGFDTVAPNRPVDISSWAYDKAVTTPGITIIDNRAMGILCYLPGYTLVEKIQTIIRKFRIEMETDTVSTNYMRQYYDVYSLLKQQEVQEFIGTTAYHEHVAIRIKGKDAATAISANEAFLLSDKDIKARLQQRYEASSALYYKGQPSFDEILTVVQENLSRL